LIFCFFIGLDVAKLEIVNESYCDPRYLKNYTHHSTHATDVLDKWWNKT